MKKHRNIFKRLSCFFFACFFALSTSLSVFGATSSNFDTPNLKRFVCPHRNDLFFITNETDINQYMNYYQNFTDNTITAFTWTPQRVPGSNYFYIPFTTSADYGNGKFIFDNPLYFSGLDSSLSYTLTFEVAFIGFNETKVEFFYNYQGGTGVGQGKWETQSAYSTYTYGAWKVYQFSVSFPAGQNIYDALGDCHLEVIANVSNTGIRYFGFSSNFKLQGRSPNQDIIDSFGSNYSKPNTEAQDKYEDLESEAMQGVQSVLNNYNSGLLGIGQDLAEYQASFLSFNSFFNKLSGIPFFSVLLVIAVAIGIFGLLLGAVMTISKRK